MGNESIWGRKAIGQATMPANLAQKVGRRQLPIGSVANDHQYTQYISLSKIQ